MRVSEVPTGSLGGGRHGPTAAKRRATGGELVMVCPSLATSPHNISSAIVIY